LLLIILFLLHSAPLLMAEKKSGKRFMCQLIIRLSFARTIRRMGTLFHNYIIYILSLKDSAVLENAANLNIR